MSKEIKLLQTSKETVSRQRYCPERECHAQFLGEKKMHTSHRYNMIVFIFVHIKEKATWTFLYKSSLLTLTTTNSNLHEINSRMYTYILGKM